MKIVMFQYNRGASAITQKTSRLSDQALTQNYVNTLTRSFTERYQDRLLCKEMASLRPKLQQEFVILGTWQ